MNALRPDPRTTVYIPDPPLARFLFSDTRFAWFWLLIRLYLAYTWLSSGFGKLTNPAWMQTGEALMGYWAKALEGKIYFDWYQAFIQYLYDIQAWTWFSKLVVAGELFVGLTMLLGAFVGIGAATGALLNFNFLLAGTTSSNPLLLMLELLLVLAWKTAGWYGLDRFLLPRLGVPWAPGPAVQDIVSQVKSSSDTPNSS